MSKQKGRYTEADRVSPNVVDRRPGKSSLLAHVADRETARQIAAKREAVTPAAKLGRGASTDAMLNLRDRSPKADAALGKIKDAASKAVLARARVTGAKPRDKLSDAQVASGLDGLSKLTKSPGAVVANGGATSAQGFANPKVQAAAQAAKRRLGK